MVMVRPRLLNLELNRQPLRPQGDAGGLKAGWAKAAPRVVGKTVGLGRQAHQVVVVMLPPKNVLHS